jgi:ribonucleotide reductase alpha subunit
MVLERERERLAGWDSVNVPPTPSIFGANAEEEAGVGDVGPSPPPVEAVAAQAAPQASKVSASRRVWSMEGWVKELQKTQQKQFFLAFSQTLLNSMSSSGYAWLRS